jgi:hypothetical protein
VQYVTLDGPWLAIAYLDKVKIAFSERRDSTKSFDIRRDTVIQDERRRVKFTSICVPEARSLGM